MPGSSGSHACSCDQEGNEAQKPRSFVPAGDLGEHTALETGGMAMAVLFLMLEVFLVSNYLFRRMGTMRTLNTTWWWSEVPFAGSSLSH